MNFLKLKKQAFLTSLQFMIFKHFKIPNSTLTRKIANLQYTCA